jgi:signal transduction histidine kinase
MYLKAPRLPLTWRVALLAGGATAILAGLTLLVSYQVVRSGLYGDLRRSLREDAAALARVYNSGEGSANTSLSGPTGGVVLQIYDPGGKLVVASRPEYDRATAALPASDVMASRLVATMWSGRLLNADVEVALAPFVLGVVAVIADPAYISETLADLSRTLFLAAIPLVVLGLLVGYVVAAASLRSVSRLARLASLLGPDRLEPIVYSGPNDEVGRLAHTVNALVERLRESRDAQRVFLAETSHELRTPLTSLRGFLHRASRRAGPEASEDLIDAQRVSLTMTRLVEDLLQLSRGEIVQEPSPHLVDLATDVLEPVAAEFDGVRLSARAGTLVLGDPQRLRQVIRNLVANAVRVASGAHGVAMSLCVDGQQAVMTVSDDGPGIAPELLERIFEKFYKGAGGGSGLGLAIAEQVTRHHGGTITVVSEPGATEFTVRLPLVQEDDVD